MLKEVLERTYYLNENSEKDPVPSFLVNCREQCIYLVIKKELEKVNPYFAFVDDLTIFLHFKYDNHIGGLGVSEGLTKRVYYQIIVDMVNEGRYTLEVLEELINRNGIVIIQTINEYLSFSNFYKPEISLDQYSPSHMFLLIGYDKESFYYVEHESIIRGSNFIPCNANKEVGIVNKKELLEAVQYFMRCFIIKPRFENMGDVKSRVPLIIAESLKNYLKKNEEYYQGKLYFGRKALLYLIELCESECIYLNDIPPATYCTIFEILEVGAWYIMNRRKLFAKCIGQFCEGGKKALSDNLLMCNDTSIQKWLKLRNVLEKRNIKQVYGFDRSLEKYFEEIMVSEDNLFDCLTEFYHSISS